MKYLPFILFLLLFGCSDSKKPIKIKKSNFNLIQYNRHKINFLKAEIFLPKNYVRVTTNDLRKELLIHEKDINRRKIIIKSINQFESITEDKALFLDDSNIYNIIYIFKYKHYVPFNKYSAADYLNMLQKQLSKTEVEYELLEHKYIKIKNSKIIKVKYKSIIGQFANYKTQYVISSKQKTFGINVINNENEDFYKLIKKIILK